MILCPVALGSLLVTLGLAKNWGVQGWLGNRPPLLEHTQPGRGILSGQVDGDRGETSWQL